MLASPLDRVRGIGEVTKTRLLKQYGSLANIAYAIEWRGQHGLAPEFAMEGDRKPMSLVANTLDEMGSRRVRAQENGIFPARQENPFLLFATCFG